ncbi:hypothetical protein TNCV_5111061 [Trichonephila clavipes]|nr:hypothetical protein TNCV_5111061 [Trichonephila clavipes]
MNTAVKVANFIVSRASLVHRQFKSLLEETKGEYGDLPLHSHVRWLRRAGMKKKRVCQEKLTDATAGVTKLEPALTLIPVLMRGKCI